MKSKKHKTTAAMPQSNHDYQVHDAVQTLKRAEQIKADPKLHAAAKQAAKTEAHHLRKVAGRSSGKK